MTAIIVSILAALGIGGGVMLASGGGSSDSGGAAVVSNVSPGTSGSSNTGSSTTGGGSSNSGTSNSGGSGTVGTTTGGGAVDWGDTTSGSNCSGSGFGFNGGSACSSNNQITIYPNGNPNLPAISGNLFKNTAGSAITTNNKLGQNATTLNGSNLQVVLNMWRPIPVSDTTFKLSEENPSSYKSWGNHKYVFDYGNYYTKVIFNLGTLVSDNNFVDNYSMSSLPTEIRTLNANYLLASGSSTSVKAETKYILNWSLEATLALGGRKFGLQNSDFGYAKWKSYFTGSSISSNNFYTTWGAEQMYFYNTSKQLMASEYNRYSATSNKATFNGNVIGVQHLMNNTNGDDYLTDIIGNITLTLNFANKSLSGSLTNMKVGNANWYTFALQGNINDISSAKPNFTITGLGYDNSLSSSLGTAKINLNGSDIKPLLKDNSFGHGSIVKGSNVSKDEAVGEIAFVGASQNFTNGNILLYTNLAFGAKKQ